MALDCAAIGIEIAWRAHCYHCCRFTSEAPKVIVHCAGGINRSPVTVVWWLCRYRGLQLQEAWDLVKMQRARMFSNDMSCVLKKKEQWCARASNLLRKALRTTSLVSQHTPPLATALMVLFQVRAA